MIVDPQHAHPSHPPKTCLPLRCAVSRIRSSNLQQRGFEWHGDPEGGGWTPPRRRPPGTTDAETTVAKIYDHLLLVCKKDPRATYLLETVALVAARVNAAPLREFLYIGLIFSFRE